MRSGMKNMQSKSNDQLPQENCMFDTRENIYNSSGSQTHTDADGEPDESAEGSATTAAHQTVMGPGCRETAWVRNSCPHMHNTRTVIGVADRLTTCGAGTIWHHCLPSA